MVGYITLHCLMCLATVVGGTLIAVLGSNSIIDYIRDRMLKIIFHNLIIKSFAANFKNRLVEWIPYDPKIAIKIPPTFFETEKNNNNLCI